LLSASSFEMMLVKDDDARVYQAVAQRIQTAIGNILY
jgi:hypothetical protein